MIQVIASIELNDNCRDDFLEIFKGNVPAVKAEDGCISYTPTVDIDSGMEIQDVNSNVVTIIEAWESLEHLHAHLKAPHMDSYREKVKGMVKSVSLKVLELA
jgi:quinol monooxygenase YgiN